MVAVAPHLQRLFPPPPRLTGSELWQHVDRNDVGKVRELLTGGANIEEPGWHIGGRTSTPLHNAVSRNDRRMVRLLLKFGADISQVGREGESFLHLTVRAWMGDLRPSSLQHVNYQNNMMVQLLIRKGVDVSIKDKRGWTVLHTAAYNGNVEIVVLLLQPAEDVLVKNKCGVDVLAETNCGETAEQLAKLNAHHRAKPTTPHHRIVTALKLASRGPILKRAQCVAFAMGLHERLGVGSRVQALKPELLRMVLDLVVDRVE